MRKNARSRWSWEPGGDLITLTVRVAGAAVVNDVIGHWPFDKERCVGTELTSYGELWDSPSTPLGYSGSSTTAWSPISANRGRGRGSVPAPGQIGDGRPVPVPGQIGDGDGDGDRGVRALVPSHHSVAQGRDVAGCKRSGAVAKAGWLCS